MSTRPWAKCTRGASWHCVVHSQINPPSRAKDGARGARASTSSLTAAGASHTQHAVLTKATTLRQTAERYRVWYASQTSIRMPLHRADTNVLANVAR